MIIFDQDLNILRNYNPDGYPYYGGISYNPSKGLIYVAAKVRNSNFICTEYVHNKIILFK